MVKIEHERYAAYLDEVRDKASADLKAHGMTRKAEGLEDGINLAQAAFDLFASEKGKPRPLYAVLKTSFMVTWIGVALLLVSRFGILKVGLYSFFAFAIMYYGFLVWDWVESRLGGSHSE